jgi:hypothetical protein
MAWPLSAGDGSFGYAAPQLRLRHAHRLMHTLLVVLLFGSESVVAQPASSELQQLRAEAEQLQARVEEAARALEDEPRLKRLTRQQMRELTEFVAGNMLFVLLHEMGHAHISEMELPVLGREEDAADSFAIVTMLGVGIPFTHQVLSQAAKGWFLSDRRDHEKGEKFVYYDEHGLDKQRAYQIVCLVVGSDPKKFKELADATSLPESRQASCQGDYSNASWSWNKVLEPHRRSAGQPKTSIEVLYGKGEGKFDLYARSFRSIQLLETVAEVAADRWVWPHAFALEMQSCGEPDAHWRFTNRKLTLCYEMAAEFAELYRDYAQEWRPKARKRAR